MVNPTKRFHNQRRDNQTHFHGTSKNATSCNVAYYICGLNVIILEMAYSSFCRLFIFRGPTTSFKGK